VGSVFERWIVTDCPLPRFSFSLPHLHISQTSWFLSCPSPPHFPSGATKEKQLRSVRRGLHGATSPFLFQLGALANLRRNLQNAGCCIPQHVFAELVNIDKRCGRARLPLPSLKAGVLLVGAVKDISFTVVVRPPRFALSSCSRRRCYPGEGRGVGAATHLISVVCETATPNKH
jgi:hypothetical protein